MKTIVSLATPKINCAIHIIRVSGNDCFSAVQKIVDKKISKKGYEIQKVNIVDGKKIIDSALIMKFIGPKSFTGEDTIEINCHGGYYLAQKIVNLLLKNGCVQSLPGEFSQRAFLNKKISLIEAESINNLIQATNDKAIEAAIETDTAGLNNLFQNIRNDIFKVIGQLEVNIDYPEYDDEPTITPNGMVKHCDESIKALSTIIADSKLAIPFRDGINVCIIGKPNVGKSSLLNALAGEERAIVTHIPGTTRDTVDIKININNITINFIDTAGIRKTTNEIEKIGISKSKMVLKNSDLILLVIDDSKKITAEDKILIQSVKNKNHLIVKNKSDVCAKNAVSGVSVSAKNNNIKKLISAISKKIVSKKISFVDKNILQSKKSIFLAENSIEILKEVKLNLFNKQTLDSQLGSLHNVVNNLNTILGDTDSFDFIDEMFRSFCLGK